MHLRDAACVSIDQMFRDVEKICATGVHTYEKLVDDDDLHQSSETTAVPILEHAMSSFPRFMLFIGLILAFMMIIASISILVGAFIYESLHQPILGSVQS